MNDFIAETVSFIPLSMRLIHWWCAFLSLVSMIAGGGVKRQKDAPDHITTGKAYIDDDEVNHNLYNFFSIKNFLVCREDFYLQ